MDAPLALYRRYRPRSFDEVIGQSHVTQPLQHALANNRVHHAYLFSGPRGCGKTTCARILARQLNGHTGPANADEDMDIIEIDAASHGGVDDARDLRERAFFAPVNSPYKIYIIDEAHMVSSQGFNALLKLVEEPPPHLKFIFATTEPDKVIGTIRSRTHHYPFRLVPPKVLSDYLLELCVKEQVTIEPTALPLVVRAGAGSVRDTLSVLDQLLGGAGPDGVTYELATALLGYTPDSLLDEAIDAFAAGDGGSVFGVVDKVMEIGQDPRRFAEDLLQRLRDLVIVSAVPGAIDKGLLEIPGDRAERIENQAARFGGADLTRAADVVSQGLLELRGATAPRLLLELVCARILLPGADHTTSGFQARLDRIERRLSIAAEGAPAPAAPAPATPAPAVSAPAQAAPAQAAPAQAAPAQAAPAPAAPAPASPVADAPTAPAAAEPEAPAWPETASTDAPPAPPVAEDEPTPQPPAEEPAPEQAASSAAPAAPGALGVTDVRRLWPDVLDKVMQKRRFSWIMLSQNAQVHSLEGQTLTIAMVNAGARDSFARSGSDEILRQALIDVIGGEWRIETVVDPTTDPSAPPPPAPATPPSAAATAAETAPPGPSHAPPAAEAPDPAQRPPEPPQDTSAAAPKVRASTEAVAAAREAMRAPRGNSGATAEARAADSDAAVDRNDPTADGDALSHEELLSRELGAQVIDEFPSS